MSQMSQRRVCEEHQVGAYHVCLFPGCSQHFLCLHCVRDHPLCHLEKVKEIQLLSSNEIWSEENEVFKSTVMNQMKELIEEKEIYITKSEQMVKESIQLAIATLESKLRVWIQEISEFKLYEDHEEALKSFTELESCFVQANGADLKSGDFFEQVENYKKFQKMVDEKAQPAIEKAKEMIGQWQSQLDSLKRKSDAFVENIQNSHIRNLFMEFETERNSLQKEKSYQSPIVQSTIDIEDELEQLREENSGLLQKVDTFKRNQRHLESCILGFSEISKIVKGQHYTYIAEWIPKPFSSKLLELKLLYQGTKDGFSQTNFETKCGDHKPLICFIKSQGHGRVFGGYTSKGWKANTISPSSGFIEDEKAFLFSLSHFEKYPCRQPQNALWKGSGHIFCFANDIAIKSAANQFNSLNSSSSEFPSYYKCDKFSDSQVSGAKSYLAGAENFIVEEIEVFKVVWK